MRTSTTRSLIHLLVIATCFSIVLPISSLEGGIAAASANRVAPCQGSELWGTESSSAGTGNFVYNMALINVGHTTCRLSGYPKIQGFRGGRNYDLRVARHGTFAGNLEPTVLTPRMSGELLLSTSDFCNALNTGGIAKINEAARANTYSNLTIKLPGTAGNVYLSGFNVDVACGLEVSRLGWRAN